MSSQKTRGVERVLKSQPVIEGAGVHLMRAFGFHEVGEFDPFLLLDDFRSDDPRLYLKGFPWHPHRGIETITYVLDGRVEHGDSMGNEGAIGPGDVQWMTAGNGIIHQEMPKGDANGRMGGFQLWTNLPSSHKMMAPRYREVKHDTIPVITTDKGVTIKVIAGRVDTTQGPVRDIVTEPEFLDVSMPSQAEVVLPTVRGHTVLAYIIEGQAQFGGKSTAGNRELVVFTDGDSIAVSTAAEPARFLLFAGRPLHEPIAWSGSIVMNTDEELARAHAEYREGTFIKHPAP